MPYATQQDLIDLYGEDALSLIADRDGDLNADAAVVDTALARASDEIDAYVGARYPLPLPIVPAVLKQAAGDIAIYRLAIDGAALRDEHRQRYEDAIALLKRIADGKAVLALPPDPEDPNGGAPRPIVTSGPERLFSREKMRGL